jgi:tRNA(Arg) A34 adenosine deaminase TadA
MLFLLFITSLFTLCLSHSHGDLHNHGHDDPSSPFFHKFTGTETINGVPPEVRNYGMKYALQTRIDLQGPCPRDAFGAVLVNRTTNTALCETNQLISHDLLNHAEIRIIQMCAFLFETTIGPGSGKNMALWAETSLYTTAESCPLCAAAEIFNGVGEVIYATPIEYLSSVNIGQVLIPSVQLVERAIPGGYVPSQTVISFQDTSFYDQYFSWQNVPTAPCPGICHRDAANSCVPGKETQAVVSELTATNPTAHNIGLIVGAVGIVALLALAVGIIIKKRERANQEEMV